MKKPHMVILGAGPVGLWFALGLVAQGFPVTLIEKSQIFSENLAINPDFLSSEERYYALSLKTKGFLHNIEKTLLHRGIPGKHLEGSMDIKRVLLMRENQESSFILEENQETFGFMVSHKHLVFQGLTWAIEAIKQKKLYIYSGQTVEHFSYNTCQEQWTLCLQGEKKIQGDFLFPAIGILPPEHPLREIMNIGYSTWDYNEKALVVTMDIQENEDIFLEYFHHHGVLALLPIGNKKSIVISMGPKVNGGEDYREKLWKTINDVIRSEDFLRHKHNHGHGKNISSFISAESFITPGQVFPLCFSLGRDLAYPRGMLLGSSAANVHPMAGYGLNAHFSFMEDILKTIGHDFFQPEDLYDLGAQGREKYKKLGFFTTTLLYTLGNNVFPLGQKKLWSGISIMARKVPSFLPWLKKKGQGY